MHTYQLKKSMIDDLHRLGYGSEFRRVYFDALIKHFNIGDVFEASNNVNEFFTSIKTFPAASSACYYVLSSVVRGERMILPALDLVGHGANFLDVGCGFGGSLIAAGRRGANVYGIELDNARREATAALLSDNKIAGFVANCDIFTSCFDDFPKMDVIVCENVIEHVDDPRKFIKRMFEKVKCGGVLLMEIPNGQGLSIVRREPHYGAPFMSLLSHESAKTYFHEKIGTSQYGVNRYEVGGYFPLNWYTKILSDENSASFVTLRQDGLISIEEANELLRELKVLVNDDNYFEPVNPLLVETIREYAQNYISDAEFKIKRCITTGGPSSPFYSDLKNELLAAAWIVRFQKK